MTPALLISIRESLQWTQDQAAEYLELSRSQYLRMENGHQPIRKAYAIAMLVKAPKSEAMQELMKTYEIG